VQLADHPRHPLGDQGRLIRPRAVVLPPGVVHHVGQVVARQVHVLQARRAGVHERRPERDEAVDHLQVEHLLEVGNVLLEGVAGLRVGDEFQAGR
jgi:hypothetical protein